MKTLLWSQLARIVRAGTRSAPRRNGLVTAAGLRLFAPYSALASPTWKVEKSKPVRVGLSKQLFTSTTCDQKRTIFIQTEATPNQDCIKFLPGAPVMQNEGTHAEFLDLNSTKASPLARRIFQIQGITGVFYGPDFVTVSKRPDFPWSILKPEIFACIMENFSAGHPLFLDEASIIQQQGTNTVVLDTDTETVAMIKELLDTRVRPALQEDGGDVEFRSFGEETDGIVRLRLKGSCRGCDSSSVTLKNGVERMLMHYIPEVLGVEPVLDQALSDLAHADSHLSNERQREDALGFSP